MQKKSLIKLINSELSTLTELVENFTENQDIHPIEIDLALRKTKDVYNDLILLRDRSKATTPILTMEAKEKSTQEITPLATEAVIAQKTPTEIEVQKKIEPKEAEKTKQVNTIENKEPRTVKKERIKLTEETPIIEKKEQSEKEVKPSPTDTNKTSTEIEAPKTIETKNEALIIDVPKKTEETIQVNTIENKEIKTIKKECTELTKEKIIVATKEQSEKESKPSPTNTTNLDSNTEIIADKFHNNEVSINETLSSIKKNKDLATQLQGSPITDLKRSIKINDRIWFINELFEKNADIYNATLEDINNAPDLDTALSKLFEKFNWNQEKKSTIAFLELVFRRFANQ